MNKKKQMNKKKKEGMKLSKKKKYIPLKQIQRNLLT